MSTQSFLRWLERRRARPRWLGSSVPFVFRLPLRVVLRRTGAADLRLSVDSQFRFEMGAAWFFPIHLHLETLRQKFLSALLHAPQTVHLTSSTRGGQHVSAASSYTSVDHSTVVPTMLVAFRPGRERVTPSQASAIYTLPGVFTAHLAPEILRSVATLRTSDRVPPVLERLQAGRNSTAAAQLEFRRFHSRFVYPLPYRRGSVHTRRKQGGWAGETGESACPTTENAPVAEVGQALSPVQFHFLYTARLAHTTGESKFRHTATVLAIRHLSDAVTTRYLPVVRQLLARSAAVERNVHESSWTWRKDHEIRVSNALSETRRQLVQEEETVRRVRHQMVEEVNQVEKRLVTRQAAAAEELTDQVYSRLARRLQMEKERLGP